MQYAMLCDLLTVRTVVLSQKNNTVTLLTFIYRNACVYTSSSLRVRHAKAIQTLFVYFLRSFFLLNILISFTTD